MFPCKDVSFHSVREYTFSLIYTALRVVHLFCLFLGLSFQKKTSCHKFHTIHGYKRSLVIGHNLPHETRFRFLQIPISTDDLRYWDISSITSQLMPPAGLSTQKKCQIGTPQLLAYFFIRSFTFKISNIMKSLLQIITRLVW